MAWYRWGDLVSPKTKPLDCTVTLLASISLASASAAYLVDCCCVAAYAEWAVAQTLRWRACTLFVCQVHFRAYRSLLRIAQSSIRLIVVRSSTPSLTRHLSCCACMPAKSGGDCWHDPHFLLGDVQTGCFCCYFYNQQGWFLHSATQCWFPQWQHKGLWLMHLLQWQSQRDQFHRRRYGALLQWYGVAIGTINFIVSALAPSGLLNVVAQSPIVARGSSLLCTTYVTLRPFVVRGSSSSCMMYSTNLPLWQGAHCFTQSSCHPWQQFVVALFGKGLIVALLDECSLLGILIIRTLGIVHAILCSLAVLALGNVRAFFNVLAEPHIGLFVLLVIEWRDMVVVTSCEWQHIIFDCCMGVALVLPLHSSVIVSAPCDVTKKWLPCWQHCFCGVAINIITGASCLCNHWWVDLHQ